MYERRNSNWNKLKHKGKDIKQFTKLFRKPKKIKNGNLFIVKSQRTEINNNLINIFCKHIFVLVKALIQIND